MEPPAWIRDLWIGLAAVAGGVTALSFREWKQMRRAEILMVLFVGAAFAIFVAPWVAHAIFRLPVSDTRGTAAIVYIMGSGSNALLPWIITRFKRLWGNGLAARVEEPVE